MQLITQLAFTPVFGGASLPAANGLPAGMPVGLRAGLPAALPGALPAQPVAGSLPWLSILVAVPALVALALWVIKPLRQAGKHIALAASLLILLVTIVATCSDFTVASKGTQMYETHQWIPAIGLTWSLGVTGLSLVMIILAVALVPLVLLAAWKEDEDPQRAAGYAGLILLLEAFMVLIFAARDVLLFYIAFEGMIIPLYFLIGRYGGENRRHAAIKFVLYSLAGGLVMLFGVVGVYLHSTMGPDAYSLERLLGEDGFAPGGAQMWMLLTFLFAFAIKAPLVPFHTWLPTTAQAARPGTSVLLVGVLDKVGTFGMVVYCWALFPVASKQVAPILITLAVISVIYGALAALWQKDLLRLVSFTSISHFGFIIMGLYIGSVTAIEGALLYMLAHGVSIAAMFLISGWLTQRGGTQEICAYGGMQRVTPLLAGTFLVSGLASVALPGLSGFVPEYYILLGTFQVNALPAVLCLAGVVLSAVYLLLPYQRLFTGPVNKDKEHLKDLDMREKVVVAPLLVAMLVLGFYPGPVMETLKNDAVTTAQLAGGDTVTYQKTDAAAPPRWEKQAAGAGASAEKTVTKLGAQGANEGGKL